MTTFDFISSLTRIIAPLAKQAISFECEAYLVCPPRNLFHTGLSLGRTALRWIKAGR
jgi:hypothetical protein